jgi:hypothetical protein
VHTDNTTSGAWRGHYGSAGLVFWAHQHPASDLIKLPNFVAQVAMAPYAAGRAEVLDVNSKDPRALEDPDSSIRNLGMRATQIPSGA